MSVPKSRYACPSCGEYQLYYPDIKGEYSHKDTNHYHCRSCDREFIARVVREDAKKEHNIEVRHETMQDIKEKRLRKRTKRRKDRHVKEWK